MVGRQDLGIDELLRDAPAILGGKDFARDDRPSLHLLPAPLARLDARRDGSEWFVFNRRGLCKALDLADRVVQEVTPLLKDRPGPGVAARELTIQKACHARLRQSWP